MWPPLPSGSGGFLHGHAISGRWAAFIPRNDHQTNLCMTHSTLRKYNHRRPQDRKQVSVKGPSQHSISAILAYSKALRVVQVPPVGEIGLILN
jgi:hypothetical protein